MPMATLNNTQNAQPNTPAVNAASQSAGNAPSATVPFARAAKHHVEQGQTQVLASASWASGQVQQYQVPTFWVSEVIALYDDRRGGGERRKQHAT